MKKINMYVVFLVFSMFSSLQILAEDTQQNTWGSWWKSIHLTDYLPGVVQSWFSQDPVSQILRENKDRIDHCKKRGF